MKARNIVGIYLRITGIRRDLAEEEECGESRQEF